jgi:hypothetical protein
MLCQRQEAAHLGGGESYEMECALLFADLHIVQLKYSCQVIHQQGKREAECFRFGLRKGDSAFIMTWSGIETMLDGWMEMNSRNFEWRDERAGEWKQGYRRRMKLL